jgi:hypothetical protein
MREEDKQDDRIITTLEPTGAEQRRNNKQSYRLTTQKYKKNKKNKNKTIKLIKTKTKKNYRLTILKRRFLKEEELICSINCLPPDEGTLQ